MANTIDPWIPKLTEDELKTALEEYYHLHDVTLQKLSSYGDQNIQVTSIGKQFVMKIYSSRDDSTISEAHCRLFEELAMNEFPAPRIIKNIKGSPFSWLTGTGLGSGGEQNTMQFSSHLQTYIPGQQLSDLKEINDNLFYEVGRFLGRYHVLLKDYTDPFYVGYLSKYWSLTRLPDLWEHTDQIPENERSLLQDIINEFKIMKQEHEAELPKGPIHGDPNETNIIVRQKLLPGSTLPEHEICGLIDFGETSVSCYIYDIAIFLRDLCLRKQNCCDWYIIGEMLKGYNTQRPITTKEISALKVCICGRFVQFAVNGYYSLIQEPENEHVKYTLHQASSVMKQLHHMTNDTFFSCANIPVQNMVSNNM